MLDKRSDVSFSRSSTAAYLAFLASFQSTDGLLNLIDLAGSERATAAAGAGVGGPGAAAARLRETQSINRSLSALGSVPKQSLATRGFSSGFLDRMAAHLWRRSQQKRRANTWYIPPGSFTKLCFS